MGYLDEYDIFKDYGKNSPLSVGYKRIQVHLVYYAKHYVHHKAMLVADGNLTDIPI